MYVWMHEATDLMTLWDLRFFMQCWWRAKSRGSMLVQNVTIYHVTETVCIPDDLNLNDDISMSDCGIASIYVVSNKWIHCIVFHMPYFPVDLWQIKDCVLEQYCAPPRSGSHMDILILSVAWHHLAVIRSKMEIPVSVCTHKKYSTPTFPLVMPLGAKVVKNHTGGFSHITILNKTLYMNILFIWNRCVPLKQTVIILRDFEFLKSEDSCCVFILCDK
jgi:hypothetical protein